ncbi:hypothetical protein A3A67_02820 [Candidatus Peribacteria bacterium RIFCSPLOWO2_01_FULL_51_18]|nr:MAG: hypothetical protein A3C52_03435 [Candidatus Peribacteria bacterium RIFCSPHIGHO2_02_FULL_51_15]OGJ66490.1 MAG: hypothetical protein A3A67_02820 [Candidatus Peribacteria bacterium RIFCSPLOWO2_01_FULL_51_18]
MPFCAGNTAKKIAAVAVVFSLMPLNGWASESKERLAQARDAFDDLWNSASETRKKRDDLEQNLENFDQKVEQARRDLAQTVDSRRDIREKIAKKRTLIELLEKQIKAAGETESFYSSVALNEKDDYVAFIRYISSKETAYLETGPVFGGSVLRRVLKGSLGESIDEQLAGSALIKARGKFLKQVGYLVEESGRAEERLKEIAKEYTAELESLEGQSKILGSIADKNAAFIDDSWRLKKLTEEELQAVAREEGEAQARVYSMRDSLASINNQLREERLSELRSELKIQENNQQDLLTQIDGIERKSTALKMLNDAAMRALQNAMQKKNTDKKLYKKIDELKQSIGVKEEELKKMGTGSKLAPGRVLMADLDFQKEQLALMEEGIPADAARERVSARRQAEGAEERIADYAEAVQKISAETSLMNISIEKKMKAIEATEKETGFEGLPPIFSWPVRGPLTATFLDAAYKLVFGMVHRAVDIAVAQGSPVKAIAEGVVFAVKDGGAKGYSYILIGHRNGYASLYGHVSFAMVKKGDIIRYGQTIALSGGKPGTNGSGPMTTGPHLHLEIMKDGEHVNPLSVLPK